MRGLLNKNINMKDLNKKIKKSVETLNKELSVAEARQKLKQMIKKQEGKDPNSDYDDNSNGLIDEIPLQI